MKHSVTDIGFQECYNFNGGADDGQAWRLKNFKDGFLVPMMQNAANAIRARHGRVIINIANTVKSAKGEHLVDDLLEAAEAAGLRWVETLGMRLSTRMSAANKDTLRAEPLFVFE